MAAPHTVLTYPLDGNIRDFTIPFEYLARKFVVVTLIGTTRRVLTLNSDYRFATRTLISTTQAWGPAEGYDTLEVRRVTSATERLVDFNDGSILRAYDLNTAQVQSLHIAEEARDLTADTIAVDNEGNLDARGRRIVNTGDGVLDGDAVNLRQQKAWAESALNQAQEAARQAQASAASAGQSQASAANSARSETAAQASAGASQGSANASQVSAGAAEQAKATAVEYGVAAGSYRDQAAESAVEAGRQAGNARSSAEGAQGDAVIAKECADLVLAGLASLGSVPLGTIVMIPRNSGMSGFLWCGGEAFDVEVYPELFAYLGTNILPDLRGRYVKGATATETAGAAYSGSIPAHHHGIREHGHTAWTNEQGHHTHGAASWADANGHHYHYSPSSGWVLNGGNATGGAGVGSGNEGSNGAGNHSHVIHTNIHGAGSHTHSVGVSTHPAFETELAGSGAKVETDRYIVHYMIKATRAPESDLLASLFKRITAMESKIYDRNELH